MVKKYKNRMTEFLKFIVELYENPDYSKMPYRNYLYTQHWLRLREIKLQTVDNRCQICYNEKYLNVHHRTYERLGHERLSDLTVLCRECHELFHKHGKLKK